jgi:RNA binding exosome subunit
LLSPLARDIWRTAFNGHFGDPIELAEVRLDTIDKVLGELSLLWIRFCHF